MLHLLGIVQVRLESILRDSVLLNCCSIDLIALHITTVLQSLFDHAHRLLLVTQCREATERHIVRPVEASEVLRVLHSVGPVRLRFEVLGDLATTTLVFLLWLRVLHQRVIEHVHFLSLLCLL